MIDCRADSPNDAAYHLVAACGCCDPKPAPNRNVERIAEAQISNLDRQRQVLEQEMRDVEYKIAQLPTLLQLGSEIKFLNALVMELQQQNQRARAVGLQNLQSMAVQYTHIEYDHSQATARNIELGETYHKELQINHSLKSEIDVLIHRIHILHNQNNDLVRMFI